MASIFWIRSFGSIFGIRALLLAIFIGKTHSVETNVSRTPISLGGFFSFGGNEGNSWDTSGILAAVEMAIELVNEREDLLVDYELKLVWNDTKVSFQSYSIDP